MLHAVADLAAVDAAVLHAVDEIRHGLRHALARPRRWNGTLRRQAQARSVRGSNSIEGILVSEDQALAIVGNESDQVSVDATWLAVRGYSEVMTFLQVLADRQTPLTEEDLLALHFMVQSYDLGRGPGRYRHGEVFVHDDDSGRRVYTGPEADAVPGLMGEYLTALAELAASDVHPMVQGAMAHLNLVMIHPFSDGNGRMSRIVQSYMLYREHVAEAQFVSIEEYLGRNTSAYYDILARTGRGRWSPELSASEWIEFTLTAHYRQTRTVQGRLWSADRVAEQVDDIVGAGLAPERATAALELAFSGWGLRNATYRELAEVTATTASRDLSALVGAGILQRHGAKKGAWYSPAEVYRTWLTELREQTKSSFDAGADPYRLASRGEEIPVGFSAV